jgi:hypothetical protein
MLWLRPRETRQFLVKRRRDGLCDDSEKPSRRWEICLVGNAHRVNEVLAFFTSARSDGILTENLLRDFLFKTIEPGGRFRTSATLSE